VGYIVARYDTQDAEGFAPNDAESPALVSPPVIFIAPSARTVASGEIWIAVSCVSANYGGCIVHVSNDGASYHRLGVIHGNATHGVLTAALPSGSGTDVINTLAVDIADTGNTIESVSQATADTHDSLVYAGGEFLAYRDATLTGLGLYNLTYLERGLYGSTAGAASGANFALIDSSIFRYGFNKNLVGSTVYLKFQAFNNVGRGLQDMADLVAYSFAVTSDGGVKALLSDFPSSYDWSAIINTPTTLAGYGIGDAYTKTYVDAAFASQVAYTNSGLASKQTTLVSGTNIKTVNGSSLLGSGDVAVSGGGGAESGVAKAYKYLNY
jgi:hypothetical protein